MSFIGRSWRGEERLWKVFWLYGVLLGIVIQLGLAALSFALGKNSFIETVPFYFIYMFWFTVAEWRCAFNADWTLFSYIVRLFAAISALGIFVVVIGVTGLILTGHSQYVMYGIECNQGIEEAAKTALKNGTGFGNEEQRDMFKNCINDKIKKGDVPTENSSAIAAPTEEKASWDTYYLDGCKDKMTDYAKQNNLDPQQYIEENQAWLDECVQAYKKENAAGSKKTP